MKVSNIGAVLNTHSALIDTLAGLLEEFATVLPLNQAAKAKVVTGIETLRVGAETLGVAATEIGQADSLTSEAATDVDTTKLDSATAAAADAQRAATGSLNAQG